MSFLGRETECNRSLIPGRRCRPTQIVLSAVNFIDEITKHLTARGKYKHPLLSTLKVYYLAGFILNDGPPAPHSGANSLVRREITGARPSRCRGQRHYYCTLGNIAMTRLNCSHKPLAGAVVSPPLAVGAGASFPEKITLLKRGFPPSFTTVTINTSTSHIYQCALPVIECLPHNLCFLTSAFFTDIVLSVFSLELILFR